MASVPPGIDIDTSERPSASPVSYLIENTWIILIVAWIVAWGIGYVGFAQQHVATDGHPPVNSTFWRALYQALQLFVLQSDPKECSNGFIQVARWLAPAVAAYTVIIGLVEVFYEQFQRIAMHFRMGTIIVICGLGATGFTLVKHFRKIGLGGHIVVVIEKDSDNDYIRPSKELGAIVLNGNAASIKVLRKAMVHKAHAIYVVCGDDSTNANIANGIKSYLAALRKTRDAQPLWKRPLDWLDHELLKGSSHPLVELGRRYRHWFPRHESLLTCYVHATDIELWAYLRQYAVLDNTSWFNVEVFNIFEIGAKLVLHRDATWQRILTAAPEMNAHGERIASPPPAVMLVGFGYMGRHLLTEMAYQWWQQEQRRDSHRPMHATVIDLNAHDRATILGEQYPTLRQYCVISPSPMDVRSAAFYTQYISNETADANPPDVIYVSLGDDGHSLSTALTLKQRYPAVPIVILLTSTTDIPNSWFCKDNTAAYGLLDGLNAEIIMQHGIIERLARAFYELYVDVQFDGVYEADHRPWREINQTRRHANIQLALGSAQFLRTVNCTIRPRMIWDAEIYEFSDTQNVIIATQEHERWFREKLLQGWKYGPQKNAVLRIDPDLVPWETPEEIPPLNRVFIQRLPRLYADVGFDIVPVAASASACDDPAPVPART
jgi:hypothetical protein